MTRQPPDITALDPVLGDRFDVVELYSGGEGWSAAVRRKDGGERLFLKVLDPGVEVREGSLLASLHHPRIPRVLEVGRTEDGRAYLLREHLDGTPLTHELPLDPARAQELAVQLLELLAFVHLRGILHLDVKPANVLRCGDDSTPRYVLLDFGLGRRGAGPATGGTYFYAAPERLLGMEPDPRSDLFSVGVLLFAALRTSKSPLPLRRFQTRFPRDDFFTAVGEPSEELPAPFDGFLPRLLARAPEQRFADAQEALEALIGGGSGRPSTDLLRPDSIQLFGADLERAARDLDAGTDLRIEGGDAEDRQALALHAGCTLEGVQGVDEAGDRCVLHRGGAGQAAVFEIPDLQLDELAHHLQAALALDAEAAGVAAHALQDGGATSPARVAQTLVALVEQGRILPDGPHWIWPDALSGRVNLEPIEQLPATPEALRRATSRGHVEAALAAYRAQAPTLEPAADRELRAALAEGFLLGGEPGRALPLVHDLPVLGARALLDLGQVRAAEAQLSSVPRDDDPALAHLVACLDYARGDVVSAERRTRDVDAEGTAPEGRVLRGLVLTRLGRAREALTVQHAALAQLDATARPFLRAACLTNLADAERGVGDLAAAQAHHEEALQLYRQLGHVRYNAMASSNLGVIAKDRGQLDEARDHLRRARALYEHVDDRTGAARAEANLGIVSLEAGDAQSAVRRLEQALQEFEQLGSLEALPTLLVYLARAHAVLGDRDQALTDLERAGPLTEERLREQAEKVHRMLEPTEPTPHEPRPIPAAPALPTQRDLIDTAVPGAVFQTFLAVNRRLAGEADLERAMQFLLDAAVTLTGGRLGYLLLSRPDGLRVEVRTGPSHESAAAFSRSMVNRAMQRRQVITSTEAMADRDLIEMPSVRELSLRSAICVPFISASGIEGAIYVEHPGRPDVFGDADKERLDVLADQAAIAVDRLLHEEKLASELERSRRDLQVAKRALSRSQGSTMLGKSKPMKVLREEIRKLAPSDLSVLVIGETGTGKELVARALHNESARSGGPFVSENCSAIPADLMESELFGHCKGAFTGADEDRPGLLELASGGTLFLDEVGDMPPPLQAKLLRVLQEQRSRRVGGQETIPLDIRLLAATHKDLRAMVADGSFREDLYYRLAAAELRVPPLRERGDDTLLLAREFTSRLNREHRRSVEITDAGAAELLAYTWPGNVRELEHVIARAFILIDGDELSSFDLPAVAPRPGAPTSGEWPVVSLAEAEARTIRAALKSTGGDKTKAAKTLKISRTALYEKLKRMNRDQP